MTATKNNELLVCSLLETKVSINLKWLKIKAAVAGLAN
jgi:hypothetical protein